MKQGHSMDQFMLYDNLLDTQNEEALQDQLQSNLISYLRQQKLENKTLDFKVLVKSIEPLCYSHALILLNRKKLVQKLLGYLQVDAEVGNDTTTKCLVLEMLIALIKDLRQECYQDFKEMIMPHVISIIDVQNIEILDKVFTLFSFCFKYLLKPIREDLKAFYDIFQELLIHKNKHLRSFASQCFSYVLRKVEIDSTVMAMIVSPIYRKETADIGPFQEVHLIQGISDALYEMMYGANSDLHSKAVPVLQVLFELGQDWQLERLIRFLMIKMVNAIDTTKQSPLFEALYFSLVSRNSDPAKLKLGLQISLDLIKLKLGSRISHSTVILMVDVLTQLMSNKETEIPTECVKLLAHTLSYLYYFKFQNVAQIFAASQQDIAHSKSIFTFYVYRRCAGFLEHFFKIFLNGPSGVETNPEDLGQDVTYGSILGFKQNSNGNNSEFTLESHIEKFKTLHPSFKKHVLDSLIQPGPSIQTTLDLVAIYCSLCVYLKNKPQSVKQEGLQPAFDQLYSKSSADACQVFTLNMFARKMQLAIPKREKVKKEKLQIDLDETIKENLVLSKYAANLDQKVLDVFSFENKGFIEDLEYHVWLQTLHTVPLSEVLSNPSDLYLLRLFNSLQSTEQLTFTNPQHLALAEMLRANLYKTSSALRIETLLLLTKFEILKFSAKPASEDVEISATYKDQPCDVIQLLLQFERLQISFETEKIKETIIEKIEVMVKSGLVPEFYLEILYSFLIGCFWIKFTPIFENVSSCICAILKYGTDGVKRKVLNLHVEVMTTVRSVSQLGASDNDELVALLQKKLNKTEVQGLDLVTKVYLKQARIEEEFLETKDFFFHMCKSIGPVLSQAILTQKQLRETLFQSFYDFIDLEYLPLHRRSKHQSCQNVIQNLKSANVQENETFKGHKKQAYASLSSYLEMLKRSESLKQVPQIAKLQSLLVDCLNTTDNKLQKGALDCLTKSGYLQGLLQKYKKLLEGFCDDEKFKDMIPILIHGSQSRSGDADIADEYMKDTDDKMVQKAKRKETKSVIPKLDEEDRSAVLPLIIKLLQSKLMQKKGAINKKSLHVRRNIVYQFFSTLNPETEFRMFFEELLLPLNLNLNFENADVMNQLLSCVNFNQYLTFINSLEIVFKQVGTLLTEYLPKLSDILVKGVLRLVNLFLKQHLDSEDENVHQNAWKQAKECQRKGLGLVKDIFRKFSNQKEFISLFSTTVYDEVIKEQLPNLKNNYVSDKSQLLEIICVNWVDHVHTLPNFLKYSEVIPAVMDMLSHKSIHVEVTGLHMSLLKKLILETLDDGNQDMQKRKLKQSVAARHQDSDEDEQQQELSSDAEVEFQKLSEELKGERKALASQILNQFVQPISVNIHAYWTHHVQDIHQALQTRGQRSASKKKNLSTRDAENQKHLEKVQKFHIAKDLLFVQSEISCILPANSEINRDFLNMIVSIMSIRNIHNPYFHYDDLILFGVKSIIGLLAKVKESIDANLVDKILQLYLFLNHKKARSSLSVGLGIQLGSWLQGDTLDIVQNMNRLKRGVADMEIDSDSIIMAVKQMLQKNKEQLCFMDLSAITYNILYLVQNEEYSVREYALHAFEFIFECLRQQPHDEQSKLVQLIENQVVGCYLHTVKQELTLKTVLHCLRSLIVFSHAHQIQTRHQLQHLHPLCDVKDETLDFFLHCLSIKLKDRQRSLKLLKKALDSGHFENSLKSVEHVVMPIVDYLVFGGKDQRKNNRDTVSYEKDQKLNTLNEGLSIYEAYANQLKWSEYYKLLKKMLFKLQRASNQSKAISAEGEPELQKEKLITKAICKVLDGFHFNEVPDVILSYTDSSESLEDHHKLWNTDFTDLLQQQLVSQPEQTVDVDADQEEEEEPPQSEEEDIEMASATDIQEKLLNKVLPILESHITESSDKHTVRSFVTVCYSKIIRKLPQAQFNLKLHKLVNLIVVQGLRSKDLSHREKARKALVKLVQEISPKFLALIFDEMKTQLTRGFQQHVYLFSIHFLLNGLMTEGQLTPGCISAKTININMDILLSELFGELEQEKSTEDHQKKVIKESKARKAIPIFEIMAQFTDFKTSFMQVLAPIINTLDSSPSAAKVQQCEDLLSRVSSALLKNQTVQGPQLLLFLYSIVERGIRLAAKIKINDEKESRDYGAGIDKSVAHRTKEEQKEMNFRVEMYWNKGNQTVNLKKTQEISGRVLASFGLQCFKKALKNKDVLFTDLTQESQSRSEELIARLDPFVLLILNSFKTYHNPICVTALNIMTQIIDKNLPSFRSNLKKFLNRIFKLFQQTQSSDSDFLNSLFKCTSELIRTYAIYQDLSELQIRTLVEIIKSHVNKFQVQNNALQCLRSVIHRRFECADLYDLIEQVQELMVFNTSASIRQLCSSCFIQFLLDYPLSSDRVEQHINFVIKNLGCSKTDGRLQLLDVLRIMLEKLPTEVIELYCEMIFFSLLLRAVNDENTYCRVAVQKTMQVLVFNPKINKSKVKSLLNTVLKMGSEQPGKKEMLLMAKMNAFQMLVQSGSDGQQSLKLKKEEITSILNSVHEEVIRDQVKLLQSKLQASRSESDDDEEQQPEAMQSFLKAIDLMDEVDVKKIQEEESPELDNKPWTLLYHALTCVEKLLEFQDKKLTVNLVANSKLAKVFCFLARNHSNYWVKMVSQRILGRLFACQVELNSDLTLALGLEVPEQLQEFTYDLICCLYQQISTSELKDQIVKNLLFLFTSMLKLNSGLQEKIDYPKLFRKLSFLGRKAMLDIKTSHDRLETILQFYSLSVQYLLSVESHTLLRDLCQPMLELVYRTYTDDQYPRGSLVKDQSIELMELMQSNVDKPFFIETYNSVKQHIQEKRSARKMQQKQLVATAEGIAMRNNKRKVKMEKKKARKQEEIFMKKMRA